VRRRGHQHGPLIINFKEESPRANAIPCWVMGTPVTSFSAKTSIDAITETFDLLNTLVGFLHDLRGSKLRRDDE
jgi:hypothetical protein